MAWMSMVGCLVVIFAFSISAATLFKLTNDTPSIRAVSGYAWMTAGVLYMISSFTDPIAIFINIFISFFCFLNAYTDFKARATLLGEIKK